MCTVNANVYETQAAFKTPAEPHRLVQIQLGGHEVTVRGGVCLDSVAGLMDDTLNIYCQKSYLENLPEEFRHFNVENMKRSAENLR